MENEENIEDVEVNSTPTEETQTDLLDSEETTQNDMVEDVPTPTADYYGDYYYSQVINKLTNLETSQNTIINNQDTIIEKLETSNDYSSVTVFFLAIAFVYMFVRDILHLK